MDLVLQVALRHLPGAVLRDQHAVAGQHLGLHGIGEVVELPAGLARLVNLAHATVGAGAEQSQHGVAQLAFVQIDLVQGQLGPVFLPPPQPVVVAFQARTIWS